VIIRVSMRDGAKSDTLSEKSLSYQNFIGSNYVSYSIPRGPKLIRVYVPGSF